MIVWDGMESKVGNDGKVVRGRRDIKCGDMGMTLHNIIQDITSIHGRRIIVHTTKA